MNDIVLVGYYEQNNFGDDILMMVTHSVVRRLMPSAKISLRTGTGTKYAERLVCAPLGRVPFGSRSRHDLIVHGGGGTFFDFGDHGPVARLRNAVMLAAGSDTFVLFEQWLRQLSGRTRLAARHRIGLGLGVGTFSPGSPRMLESLPVLADFDALWLRDTQSLANVRQLGVSPPMVEGSDLAFLSKNWCPPHLALAAPRHHQGRRRLGVILRDWPSGSGATFAEQIAPALDFLATRYELTLIFLDAMTDAGTLRRLTKFTQRIWQPHRESIADFSSFLALQDVFITSRAHGAICAACLGRASIILGIEPKLEAIHAMLPAATRLVSPSTSGPGLHALVEEALSISPDVIAHDVERNREKSEQAMAKTIDKVGI